MIWLIGAGGQLWGGGSEPHVMKEFGPDLGIVLRQWKVSIDFQASYGNNHGYGIIGISRHFGWDEVCTALTGGRRFDHDRPLPRFVRRAGRTSKILARCQAATNCTPTGIPSLVMCSGNEIAGLPATFHGIVNGLRLACRRPISTGCSFGPRLKTPIGGAGVASVEVTRISKPPQFHPLRA